MSETVPVQFRWDGEAMIPANDYARRSADAQFVIGLHYALVPVEDRSQRSHRHYFAAIKDAWDNLPEECVSEPWAATPEHLRKYALCRTGWCHHRTIAAASETQAQQIAAFVAPMDEYALVSVEGPVVHVFTAKSQNMRAMNKEEFQASKDAVLTFLADLLMVDVSHLKRAAA